MHLSIRGKVFLAVALSLIVIFGIVIYILLTESTNQLKSDLNRESKSFASLAASPIGNSFLTYKDSGTAQIGQEINNYLDLDNDVTQVSIVSVGGQVVYSSQMPANLHISSQLASSFQPVYQTSGGYIDQIVEPLIQSGGGVHSYAIVYQISTERVKQSIANTAHIILAVGVAVLIISIVITGFMLNRMFIKPLQALSKSADIISRGNYEAQIIAKNKDEIGSLAQSLNKMAGALKTDIVKLQDLDKMKSEFMMITSHNLRTPLSIITGYIDLAHEAKTIDELKKSISTISDGVNRLHVIAENMLTIANLETGNTIRREPIKIRQFVDSVCTEFEAIALKQDRVWHYENTIKNKVELSVNQASLRSAFSSVIDNAIKFTKSGGKINITALVDNGYFKFIVEDNGVGIEPGEMAKLFTKFHRGTGVLRYDYEGLGIGLYLSKLIVEQHGGKITVESQINHGTKCSIIIPIKTLS